MRSIAPNKRKVVTRLQRKAHCRVDGCELLIHASGYCSRHYARVWRQGRHKETESYDPSDPLSTLKRKLARATSNYHNVVGLEGRLRWLSEIRELEAAIRGDLVEGDPVLAVDASGDAHTLQ